MTIGGPFALLATLHGLAHANLDSPQITRSLNFEDFKVFLKVFGGNGNMLGGNVNYYLTVTNFYHFHKHTSSSRYETVYVHII